MRLKRFDFIKPTKIKAYEEEVTIEQIIGKWQMYLSCVAKGVYSNAVHRQVKFFLKSITD